MEKEGLGLDHAKLLLDKLCYGQQPLSSFNEKITMYPGYSLWQERNEYLPVEGRYGLLLYTDALHTVPAARLGFDLSDHTILLTNSPQGFTRETLPDVSEEEASKVLRTLRQGTFRDDLLSALITLGRSFRAVGIKDIAAVSAEHHDKVDRNGGPLPYDQAMKAMNHLYERHGFTRTEEGDYLLELE